MGEFDIIQELKEHFGYDNVHEKSEESDWWVEIIITDSLYPKDTDFLHGLPSIYQYAVGFGKVQVSIRPFESWDGELKALATDMAACRDIDALIIILKGQVKTEINHFWTWISTEYASAYCGELTGDMVAHYFASSDYRKK